METLKERCFKYFDQNDTVSRKSAIEGAITEFKVKSPAQTNSVDSYYSKWRKAYMEKPLDEVTEARGEQNKALSSPEHEEKKELIIDASTNKKFDVPEYGTNRVKKVDYIFRPLILQGKNAKYQYSSNGVRMLALPTTFLNEEVIAEEQAALKVWDRYYGGESHD